MISNKHLKIHKELNLLIIIVLITVAIVITLLTLRSTNHESLQSAKTANAISLDSVALLGMPELERQTGWLSCYRTAWFRNRSCETYELRLYSTALDDKLFIDTMQQELLVHGWVSDADIPGSNFFYLSPKHDVKGMKVSVRRLGPAYHGETPMQSNVSMLLTKNKVPQLGSGTTLDYNDSLKQKINTALTNGDRLLLVSSRTTYTTPL
jgi:hypothetical protein